MRDAGDAGFDVQDPACGDGLRCRSAEGCACPSLPFKKGYADWGGEEWRQPTDPERWLKYSVVWYSQHIARDLGADELTRYGKGFGYGNADFSGDPGKNNGLERSWISSSLKISPVEQVAFLRRLVNGALPVKPDAVEKTRAVVERFDAGDGWMLQGKTGSAFPRKADGTLDRAAGWGWFVGWAEKDGRRYVFARLDQDEKRERFPADCGRGMRFLRWVVVGRVRIPGYVCRGTVTDAAAI